MLDEERARQLFRALTSDASLGDVVAAEADLGSIAAALEPIRGNPALGVVSVAVNRSRVDVDARDATDEWRVVFGCADGLQVDWVSVYGRPAFYSGVLGGRAVVVNGPSSSGKSTLLTELQRRSQLPWVVFDEPVLGAAPREYLVWREQNEVLHRGFLDGIAAVARAGNQVALAAAGRPQVDFVAAFCNVPTIHVGLHCDVAVLVSREFLRDDVPGGMAENSVGVHDGWTYQLNFDTTSSSPGDIAAQVLAAVADLPDSSSRPAPGRAGYADSE